MPSPSSYVTAQVLVPAVNGHLRSSSAATFRTFQRPPYAVTHIQAMAAVNTINDDEELVRGLEVQSHQSGYILRITGQDVVATQMMEAKIIVYNLLSMVQQMNAESPMGATMRCRQLEPHILDLPPPALELFDLDECFVDVRVRLAQLTDQCSSHSNLNHYLEEAGWVLGLDVKNVGGGSPKHLVAQVQYSWLSYKPIISFGLKLSSKGSNDSVVQTKRGNTNLRNTVCAVIHKAEKKRCKVQHSLNHSLRGFKLTTWDPNAAQPSMTSGLTTHSIILSKQRHPREG